MVSTDTRKEQIYEAASALFSRRGYHSTSVRDIARELDLQGGSLYAHITSKEDVLWRICDRAAETFFATIEPLAGADAPAGERLRRMVHGHVHVIERIFSHAAVFFQDWQHLGEPRRTEILAARDRYEGIFRRVIAEGIAAGEFAPRDPALASIYLLTAMNGMPGWFHPGGPRTADDVAEEFATLFLNGLRERPIP